MSAGMTSEPRSFSPISRNPDVIAISHKALYRSIIDCTVSLPFSRRIVVSVSSKEALRYFLWKQAKRITPNVIMCSQNQKNQLLYRPFFEPDDIVYSFKVPFRLIPNPALEQE